MIMLSCLRAGAERGREPGGGERHAAQDDGLDVRKRVSKMGKSYAVYRM